MVKTTIAVVLSWENPLLSSSAQIRPSSCIPDFMSHVLLNEDVVIGPIHHYLLYHEERKIKPLKKFKETHHQIYGGSWLQKCLNVKKPVLFRKKETYIVILIHPSRDLAAAVGHPLSTPHSIRNPPLEPLCPTSPHFLPRFPFGKLFICSGLDDFLNH